LPFAGHPTLGTAFVMVSEGRVASPLVQSVEAGDIQVEVDVAEGGRSGMARMRQLPPTYGPLVDDRPGLIKALGLGPEDLHPTLPPRMVSTGFGQLIVPVASRVALSRAAPTARPLADILEGLGTDGCYVAFADGRDAFARFFAPALTVEEDAATGSAAGPLGAYLAERGVLAEGELRITQGVEMGRPSTLIVEVQRASDGWTVFVGGGVVRVGAGHFELPDAG
jgi:PhzF family phenazine biosynthesis protein